MGKANKKIYGKVVGKDASDRPGWKGPSYTKKKPSAPAPSPPPKPTESPLENEDPNPSIPLELQQLLLNIFRDTFKPVLESNDLQSLMQEVKTALYERDFARAFGKREFLEIYSARWSPGRALCYAGVLVDVVPFLKGLWEGCGVLCDDDGEREREREGKGTEGLKVVCFGGGAAEVVAFGGFVKRVLDCGGGHEDVTGKETVLEDGIESLSVSDPVGDTGSSAQEKGVESLPASGPDEKVGSSTQEKSLENPPASDAVESDDSPSKHEATTTITTTQTLQPLITLNLLDTAPWSPIASSLTTSLIAPPHISPYANAAAKASNHPLLPPHTLTTTFHTLDILTLSPSTLSTLLGPAPLLLTLLFTLNELYTSSIPLTTAFLLALTTTAARGTLLLVVDSPGSYSETRIGRGVEGKEGESTIPINRKTKPEEAAPAVEEAEGEPKKYPMHWLMDHTLLVKAKIGSKMAWEKVVGDESRWWRVGEGLRYPIALENMRFQIHLYRRL